MILKDKERDLTSQALHLIEDCYISRGTRAAAYRQYGQWLETGRASGGLALCNTLYGHVDRVSTHLYSPSELHFAMDWENLHEKKWVDMGKVAARLVTSEWNAKNIDLLFAGGVNQGLAYGVSLMKQLAGRGDDGSYTSHGARLVMPWNFGVFNEGLNDLHSQECFVETVWLNKHEVWRRVRHLPDAETLYRRILGNSKADSDAGPSAGFMHQVLSTAVLTPSLQNNTQPMPGGIVQLSNSSNMGPLGPRVAPELYPMHELWVRNDARANGYTTICLIEPDILISPTSHMPRTNLFIERNRVGQEGPMKTSEDQPYTPIYANWVQGYFWGRSEITDLMMLQSWLTEHLDDAKRLMRLQVDKILGFIGQDGIADEMYGKFRETGYISLGPGSDVKDLTPHLPDQLIPLIGEILSLMDRASGFPPILGGQGEPGVRAGVHADTLVKTGSSRLRDRSLLVERLCASAAQTTLAVLEAKNGQVYWTDAKDEMSDFFLSQLPDDRRITVDSHSSSPIFTDDHAQLIAWGLKAGVIGPEDAIEDLPFSHKTEKMMNLKARQAAQQKLIEEHPEILSRGRGGRPHLAA